jgi:tetratricopeptide (TPR) repeat protein
MSLTDKEKQFIKEEINSVIQAQQEVSNVVQAKLEYKAEVTELLAKQQEALAKHHEMMAKEQKALHELELYKWAVRAFLLIILGGSIWTVLRYKQIIDAQVAQRMINSDRLNLAIQLAGSGQWRESLSELDDIWADLKKSPSSVDPKYKSFFCRNVLWVVSQTEERLADGSWVGAKEWKELNEDADFQREFTTTGRWDNDEVVNSNLAFASLKFDKSPQSLSTARNYLQKSLAASHPPQKQAPHLFALAMIDLLENKSDGALEKLKRADSLDPSNYSLSEYKKYKNSFLNSTEFQIWQGLASESGGNFEKSYLTLIDNIAAFPTPATKRKHPQTAHQSKAVSK